MTDTATETPAAPQFKDEFQKMQFTMLNEQIVKRNSLVGRANAAHGDRQSLTEQIRENDTDPDIVEAREQMSKWVLKLDELVKPKVDAVIADAAGSVEGIETEIKEIDSVLKPGLNYYKKLYDDDTVSQFAAQERLKGTAVRSGGGGGRRIRGFNVIVTVDGEDREFENFTQAAKHLDVDTVDLQKAFFSQAGTEDLKAVPDSVKFTINFPEVDADGNEAEKEAFVRAYRTEPTAGTTDTTTNASDSTPAAGDESAEDEGVEDPFEDDEDE